MKRRELLLSGALLSAIPATIPTSNAQGNPATEDLSPLLEKIRQRFDLPAIGAIIVSRTGIRAQGVAGTLKMGGSKPVTPDVHWQLGSITKTFTGTLIARLVEQGKLRWTTPLSEVYPELTATMAPDIASITIQQIILHHSGMGGDVIPWEGSPEVNKAGLTMPERRYRFISLAVKRPLQFAPGKGRAYSNQGYNLLGAIAERVTGRTYEDLIEKELCQPLGIRSVLFGEPALAHPDTEPWPHRQQGDKWTPVAPVPLSQYGYHACNPAGGLSLTLTDFGRWMQAHLNSEPALLSSQAFRAIHNGEREGGISPFGISTQFPNLGRSLAHNGSNGRNFTDHYILPERGIGVFLAFNASPPPANSASWFVMNTLLSHALPPGRWPQPALVPPLVPRRGNLEGEAMEVAQSTGGSVQFQNFTQLSGQFQLWWSGAKEGNRLTLKGSVDRPGRYAVTAVCGTNSDFGAVTLQLGDINTRLDFKSESLRWDTFPLGETILPEGPFELQITAQGSAGTSGIVCHLALDMLQLRRISAS